MIQPIRWAVVGAGPCGIGVVGRLVDLGHRVTWIDESFQVGRMGSFYRQVPANTLNGDLLYATKLCKSFEFDQSQQDRREKGQQVMADLASDVCLDLGYLVDPLEDATFSLKSRVQTLKGRMKSITKDDPKAPWHFHVEQGGGTSARGEVDAVITVCGCRPIHIPGFPRVDMDEESQLYNENEGRRLRVHSLDRTVDPEYVRYLVAQYPASDTWTVVGSSHSGMLVVKNLAEANVQRINLVHRSPLRFMTLKENGCKKFQGSGLKGPVGDWTRHAQSLGPENCPFKMIRYDPTTSWYKQLSDLGIDHVIVAMGFVREPSFSITVGDVKLKEEHLDQYDRWIGHVPLPSGTDSAEVGQYIGLFGGGIAFPQNYRDEEGEVEPWVGFKRSIEQTDEMIKYHERMVAL